MMAAARRLELIAARETRITASVAAPHFTAAEAWGKAATMARIGGDAPALAFDASARAMIAHTRSLLAFAEAEAAARGFAHVADGFAALAQRPCNVARWLVETRGEVLPLPNPGTPAVTARESHEGRVGCQGPGCACDTRSMERHPAGS